MGARAAGLPVTSSPQAQPRGGSTRLGERYVLCGQLASGGMATVHLGRLVGPAAFARTVAIKRLLPHFADDPDFRLMLTDEARLAARVRHPNVVQTLDVVTSNNELFLVMEYVDGVSLRRLMTRAREAAIRIPEPVLAAIVGQLLHGLHAAHEATDERGRPLGIIHRDVSPDNVLVGADGLSRVLDFGIAKATSRLQSTRDGQIKGKLAYMAPEQLAGKTTQQSDVFAASIILWEGLVNERLFRADDDAETVGRVLAAVVEPPASVGAGVSAGLSEIAMRGLARDPAERWTTARAMALALEETAHLASPSQVATWVQSLEGEWLAERRALVQQSEAIDVDLPPPGPDASGAVSTRVTWATQPAPVSASPSRVPDAETGLAVPGPTVRRRRAPFALGGVAIALALPVAWLARSVSTPAPPAVLAPAGSVAAVVPSSGTPEPSREASLPLAAEPPADPAASGSASRGARPAHRGPAAAASARPPQAGCDPPYRIGPMGEKVWLKACL